MAEADFKEERAKTPDELWKERMKANIEAYSRQVRRHGIIHAFMFECELSQYSSWAHNKPI